MAELRFPADHIVGTLDWLSAAAFVPGTGPILAVGVVTIPDGVGVHLEVQSMTRARPPGGVAWELGTDRRPVDLGFVRELPPDLIGSISLTRSVVASSVSALAHLAPGLTHLYLPWTDLTDSALPHIAGLTDLTYLQTFGNQFTDSGVQQLVALQDLEQLYLEERTLSVAAFDFVIRLPRLRTLGVQDASLTHDELDVLRSSLQRVRVHD